MELGQGRPLLPGSAAFVRVARRRWREEVGIEPQPADEGCTTADAPGKLVGSETAVADEDDRVLREPAKDLKHALSRPVCELFVTPPLLDGEAFGRGQDGQEGQSPDARQPGQRDKAA